MFAVRFAGLVLTLAVLAPLAAAQQDDLEALIEIGGTGGPSWLEQARPMNPLTGPAALGPACRGLDLREGVRSFVDRAAAGTDDVRRQAHRAATSAVAGLPWLTLRRALPEVADLFDAELARAEASVTEAASRCEQDLQAARRSDASAEGWRATARAQAWNSAGRLAATPEQAEDMSAASAEQGVLWLNGERRGGAGQQPLQVVGDAVRASAELLFEASSASPSSLWDSPTAAAAWMVDVVGDLRLSLADGRSDTEPGSGLWLQLAAEQRDFLPRLAEVVDKQRRGEDVSADMEQLQAARFGLHPEILTTLARTEPAWRQQALTRMAYELAMVATLDRALLARQLLLTALQLPEVVQLPPASALLTERLGRLEQGVESLLFEYRARQSMGGTLSRLWRVSRTQP